jgi:hypothetical protein
MLKMGVKPIGRGAADFLGDLFNRSMEDVRSDQMNETAFKRLRKNWQALFYNKMAPVPVKGIYGHRIVGVYNGLAEQAMLGTLDLNTALRQAEETSMIRLDEWKR